jgi:RimJ/RimL family protein N-acetyltransferase
MKIIQRFVTPHDSALLLSWRNDPSVRDFSLHSEHISVEEHYRWFSTRIKKTASEPFFVFESEQKVVGISRLDIVPESTEKYEISILVDPNNRGRGVGMQILNMTCDSFFRVHSNKIIVARVHKNNFISQKLFGRAGFDLLNPSGDFFSFEKVSSF